MIKSDSLSITFPPNLFISVARADNRSVSCSRRWPMFRRVEGVLAKAATAAIDGVSSPTS